MDGVESAAERDGRGKPPIQLRVEYKRLNALLADCLKHLSQPETFIATARPLPVGTEFHFVLENLATGISLTLRGRVTSIKHTDGRTHADIEEGMGISFLGEDTDGPSETSDSVLAVFREALGVHVAERLFVVGTPLAPRVR